jgi:hypothetical protein
MLSPVTDAMLAKPSANDWLMRRRNFANWGFSTSTRSTPPMSAVFGSLGQGTWSRVIRKKRRWRTTACCSWPSRDPLWEYRRELPKVQGGYHNDLFSRARGTIALHDDKVFLAAADAHIVAARRANR